jgi:hypothetical protein
MPTPRIVAILMLKNASLLHLQLFVYTPAAQQSKIESAGEKVHDWTFYITRAWATRRKNVWKQNVGRDSDYERMAITSKVFTSERSG